jgi:hypothetical protein
MFGRSRQVTNDLAHARLPVPQLLGAGIAFTTGWALQHLSINRVDSAVRI